MYRIFVDGKLCVTGVKVSCEAHSFGKVSAARKFSTRLFWNWSHGWPPNRVPTSLKFEKRPNGFIRPAKSVC